MANATDVVEYERRDDGKSAAVNAAAAVILLLLLLLVLVLNLLLITRQGLSDKKAALHDITLVSDPKLCVIIIGI